MAHRPEVGTRGCVGQKVAMPEAVAGITVVRRARAPGVAIGIIEVRRGGARSEGVVAVIAVNFYQRLAKQSPAWPSADFTGGQACC